MTLLGALLLFGCSQGLLLCVVILCIKTGDRTANTMLAAFLGISALDLGLLSLSYTGLSFPVGVYWLYAITAFKGPALYFYVCALTGPDFRLQRGQLLHLLVLLPYVALMLLQADRPLLSESVSGIEVISSRSVSWYPVWLNLLSLAYAGAALRVLGRFRSSVEEYFSSIEEISLGWLKWLLLFYITLRLGYVTMDLANLQGPVLATYRSYAVALINIGVIYFVSIGGLRQPIIFSRQFRQVATTSEAVPALGKPGRKYEKSGLSESRSAQIWQQLLEVVRGERIYINPELNLPALAAHLQVSPNDLSQVINSRAERNFHDFINDYRIEAACALLEDEGNDGLKMLAIAMEVGFNSQSSFYNHFNKRHGMTPTRYREQSRFGSIN
jgi:AraC-like DNA-binding protein